MALYTLNLPSYEAEKIPQELLMLSDDIFSSKALILAILAKDDKEVSAKKISLLAKNEPSLHAKVINAINLLLPLDKKQYLNLILLCQETLKQMNQNDFLNFKTLINEWIFENGEVSLQEWMVQTLIINHLELKLLKRISIGKNGKLEAIKSDVEFLLSFLCDIEYKDKNEAKNHFYKLTQKANLKNYKYIFDINKNYNKLSNITKSINTLTPQTKENLLNFCKQNFRNKTNMQIIFILSFKEEIL